MCTHHTQEGTLQVPEGRQGSLHFAWSLVGQRSRNSVQMGESKDGMRGPDGDWTLSGQRKKREKGGNID